MNKQIFSDESNKIKIIAISCITGLLVTMIFLFLFSILLSMHDYGKNIPTIFSMISLGVGAFISGVICAKLNKSNGLIMGVVSGSALYCLIFIISIFVSTNGFSYLVVLKLLIALICSIAGGIFGINVRKKKKYI